jgi:hypothetical protein
MDSALWWAAGWFTLFPKLGCVSKYSFPLKGKKRKGAFGGGGRGWGREDAATQKKWKNVRSFNLWRPDAAELVDEEITAGQDNLGHKNFGLFTRRRTSRDHSPTNFVNGCVSVSSQPQKRENPAPPKLYTLDGCQCSQ